MRRFKLAILSLAAIFIVTGSVISFAQVGANHGADVSAVAKPSDPPPGEGHGQAVSDVARPAAEETPEATEESKERKQNHGLFVSQAAHCEDVDDPETAESPDFTAPEDCDGAGHGEYVRSVAKSSAGKKPKPENARGPQL